MPTTIGDDNTPVYRFDWNDGPTRRTDEQIEGEVQNGEAVEVLAEMGRDDPECDVTLVGFQ